MARGGARPGAGRKPKGVAPKRKPPKRKFVPSETPKPAPQSRTQSGTFTTGASANPGGRPKGFSDLRKAAREYTNDALDTLVMWMRSDNAKAAVSAANAILDRGWGKPQQNISATIRDMRAMTDAELYGFLAGDDEQGGRGEGTAPAPGDTGLPN
jgi:hypothetical protein